MTAHQQLLVEDGDGDGLRTITFNRPEAKNAINRAMRQRLCELLSAAEQDPAVRVVIVTGTDPAFSAGVDFKETAASPAEGAAAWNAYDAQFEINPGRALRAMTTPVIAAVNGPCVSGGLEIALSSAFVVASDRARFADTHARLGVVATWGLTALLPQAVGVRKAREMSITGNFVDADEALRIGLVNHVLPHEELLPFVRRLAADVAATPAVAEVMTLYARGAGLSLAQALAMETEHTARRSFDPAAFGRAGTETAARAGRTSPTPEL
jgi:enoyl-CoA hydratase